MLPEPHILKDKMKVFDRGLTIFICQIGSAPGFEDGEFESANLARPAASFYDADEDCLYFVDSEVCILNFLNYES